MSRRSRATARSRAVGVLTLLLIGAWGAYPAAAQAPGPAALQVGLEAPSLPLTGAVTLTAAVNPPAGQTVTSVVFQERVAGASTWTSFDTDTSSPYTASLDTTTLADGNYDIRAVATDSGGDPPTSAILTDQTVANNGAFVALESPGSPLSGTAALVAEPQGNGNAPDTVTFKTCPTSADCAASGNWQDLATVGVETDSGGNPVTDPQTGDPIYTTKLDTTKLSDGSYDIYVTAGDSTHDVFQGGLVSDVVVDNSPPTVSLHSPGGTLSGTTTLTADAGDSGVGVASVEFELAPVGTQEWKPLGTATSAPFSLSLDTRQFSNGSYDLRAIATDLAGNATTSATRSVTVANSGGSAFGGLTVTDINVPASNITLLGELPGSEHETWAVGETNAPAPSTLAGAYTAEGDDQVVLLRYTADTGWQIVDVLRNADGSPYPLQAGAQTRVTGQMAPNGEAWLVVCQRASASSPCPSKVFHRPAGGQFRLDPTATTALSPVLAGSFTLRLGESGNGPVYGAVFPGVQGGPSTDQTVWTPQGPQTIPVQLEYGELQNGAWSLAGATLPAGYTAPSGAVSRIRLDAGDVTGPGTGWGAIEVDSGSQSATVLARFDNTGWTFLPATGLDALDSSGPFAAGSQQSAAAGEVSVQPTGISADGNGGFLSATVQGTSGSGGTVVAQFDSNGAILNSWCGVLPQQSYDCVQPIDTDDPAVVPGALFDGADGAQSGIALSNTPGSLSVFADGTWHAVPAPGFQTGVSVSAVFADQSNGWIAGPNTLGLVSSTPPAQALASWPEPNRTPLLAVALPPGQSTTDTSGALAVGLDGTALEYAPPAGWQVVATPQQSHNLALTGVAFASSSLAFAVGQGGTILRWNGSQWGVDPESTQLTRQTLNAVAFGADGQGWAVGAFGTILHYDGTAWSTEPIDSSDSGTDVTSVAVAGRNVFAIAGGNLIERNTNGQWARVPTSELPSPAPTPGSLELVSGLPDGGLAVAGKSLLIIRSSASASLQYSPESFNGIAVALAAFRDASGAVRAFISVAPEVAALSGGGNSEETGGFPSGDGDLMEQTAGGWDDLSQDTPANTVSAPPADGTVHPDPVLAVATSADGSHAWAVGGYAGTQSADGVGTAVPLSARPQAWYTSSIWRYDAGGSASPPGASQTPVTLPPVAFTVNFAFLSSALCASQCSAVQDAQPFVNLQNAAAEIAAYAQQPGGPAFAMLGGNAVGSMTGGAGGVGTNPADMERLSSLLAPLGNLPTYAAYGPLDGVAGQSDPATPWAQVFATAPAPFGPGPAPAGITPEGAGDPSGSDHKYYAFNVTQNSGTVRAIVLDNSQGSLEASAPGQSAWLASELAQAQAANEPVVVFAAEPLNSLDIGAASDADTVAAELASHGVVAVFTTSGGEADNWQSQPDRVSEIPANATADDPQIPEYEGATMTYQQSTNNGVLWYDVSINTQSGAVTVNGIPVIGSLALEPVDGLTAARSSTLQFQAIGRRAESTIATSPGNPNFPGFAQYVSIPSSSSCGAACVAPSYTFTSSNPVVGNFVAASGSSSSYPSLTSDGKTTASSKSGLFCAFNSGTTIVTVTSGLMSASETVTVEPGAFGPPCGTVPGGTDTNVITVKGATTYSAGAGPQGAAPIQPKASPATKTALPKVTIIPPVPATVKPAAVVVKHPVAKPHPVTRTPIPAPVQPPFVAVPPVFNTIGVSIAPPIPPPVTPVPPGGATVPAQSTAKREEKAKKEASQSAYVTRPSGEPVSGWFYPAVGGVTLVSLLLIAGGMKPGPKRAPAYAVVRESTDPRRRRNV